MKIGSSIEKGQPLAHVFCDDGVAGYASELVAASFGITPLEVKPAELITERVSN